VARHAGQPARETAAKASQRRKKRGKRALMREIDRLN
jgi:hypothetical protein